MIGINFLLDWSKRWSFFFFFFIQGLGPSQLGTLLRLSKSMSVLYVTQIKRCLFNKTKEKKEKEKYLQCCSQSSITPLTYNQEHRVFVWFNIDPFYQFLVVLFKFVWFLAWLGDIIIRFFRFSRRFNRLSKKLQ